ncbi:MAG: hypothetical protein U1E27_10875, partial [Kiritimatiellia bacterium]|nr:hypothetical protein [Kiritimatiellia bacterium]
MTTPNATSRQTGNRMQSVLERTGLLSADQVRLLVERYDNNPQPIPSLAAETGAASEEALTEALADVMRIPMIRIGEMAIGRDVLDKLPTKAVYQYRAIPYQLQDGRLWVCTADPFAPGLADALRLASGQRIRMAIGLPNEVDRAAKRLYGV